MRLRCGRAKFKLHSRNCTIVTKGVSINAAPYVLFDCMCGAKRYLLRLCVWNPTHPPARRSACSKRVRKRKSRGQRASSIIDYAHTQQTCVYPLFGRNHRACDGLCIGIQLKSISRNRWVQARLANSHRSDILKYTHRIFGCYYFHCFVVISTAINVQLTRADTLIAVAGLMTAIITLRLPLFCLADMRGHFAMHSCILVEQS